MAFTKKLIEQIKADDIFLGGEKRKQAWENGEVDLGVLRERYNVYKYHQDFKKCHETNDFSIIASVEPECPISDSINKRIMKFIDEHGNSSQNWKEAFEKYGENGRSNAAKALFNHIVMVKKRSGGIK